MIKKYWILAFSTTLLFSCKQDLPSTKIRKEETSVETDTLAQKIKKDSLTISSDESQKSQTIKEPVRPKVIEFVPPVILEKEPAIENVMVKEVRFGSPDGDYSDVDVVAMPDFEPKSEEKVFKSQEPEIYYYLEEQAQFPGGIDKLLKYIQDNLVVPTELEENQGKCYIRFVIEKDGSVSNVVVVKGVQNCPACDREAIRVIKKMERWIPGKLKGNPVRSYFTMPIKFILNS